MAFAFAARLWLEFLSFTRVMLKSYFFLWLMFFAFRLLFIFGMRDYLLASTHWPLIFKAVLLGTKMSMQTVGALVLVNAIAWLLGRFFGPQNARRSTFLVMFLWCMLFSILFIARFPYYATYHSGYNRMLFTAVHEDWQALFWTFVSQYHLAVRLPAAIILGLLLFFLWRFWERLDLHFTDYLQKQKKIAFAITLLTFYILGRLSLFNGSWSWQTQIDWENAGITSDNLLNEAILDDGQALYRAYCLQERNKACNGLSYTPEQVKAFAAYLSGKPEDSDSLSYYLEKTALGAYIKKPRHIFLIISESYANWPLLPQYAKLNLANGMKQLIEKSDTAYCDSFLPNGSSTVNALMGLTTNLADANLYLTTMVGQMKKPYITATAPQLERLGYATAFYYAGPPTWENIAKFTKAQGFEHFYCRGNITEKKKGSVWGADDADLYAFILKNVTAKPSFNVILNVSNHSPFDVNLEEAGFDAAALRQAMPPKYRSDNFLVRELGHFWYADKMMAQFIAAMRQKYPDSLFIITGDHADRYNLEKNPTMYHRYGTPLIISGPGITKKIFPAGTVGSQIDIIPTVIDLIAPRGFKYYSVGKSLTRGNFIAGNYGFWLTDGYIDSIDAPQFAPHQFKADKPLPQQGVVLKYGDAIRAVSWWEAEHGNSL